ncbi:MAG: phage tail tip lysozyme [Lachnospiraceae bacterium]|nr:phage tail tip lysozyme [Lachnospiraceae bacterium]
MKNGIKKCVAAAALAALLLTEGTLSPAAAPLSSAGGVIVGFADFDIADHYLAVDAGHRAPMAALTSAMPDHLTAILSDGREAEVPVTWYCITGDYETTANHYVQFSPILDEAYALEPSLDILTDAPYIGVFLTAEASGDQAAAVASETGADTLNGAASVTKFTYTQSPYEADIYLYLTENLGFNTAAAVGIMANIYSESTFYPNNLQNNGNQSLAMTDEEYTRAVDEGTYTNFVRDGYGYGLIQWTFWSRKQALLDYAAKQGVSIGDCRMQLDFMNQESSGYTTLRSILENVSTSPEGAYEAAYEWCMRYEQPSDTENRAVTRGNLASTVFWNIYGYETTFERISGDDRFGTAIDAADKLLELRGTTTFDTIVLAGGMNFPDALGGVPYACQNSAPILLVGTKADSAGTLKTLAYVKEHLTEGGRVVLLGADPVVPDATEKTLKAMGYDVKRLAGENRYATNMAVVSAMTVEPHTKIFIVSGLNYPDALAVSGLAAQLNAPVILAGKVLRDEALEYIASVDPEEILIIGGEPAVSSAVEAQLSDYSVRRIAGDNRYKTAGAVAGLWETTSDQVVVATGTNFPDGLVAGVLSCELEAPLFLASLKQADAAAAWGNEKSTQKFLIMGAEPVVPDAVVATLMRRYAS